ncbi:ribose-phosphate pyrophosphokinase [Candidatus Microgenomates bacterium]|nr:MAG: ribose-phosphate pyrophosphokinase [Candidatus Microgenomates bacterium]
MAKKSSFLLFSGSGNHELSLKIAKLLSVNLSKIEIVTFADSEKRVRIEENVRDKMIFVTASLNNPVDTNLVELCLIGDALKTNDAGRMVAVIPYYGYGRQDKAHREGEGISARVMAKLIESVHFNKVVTVDLHSEIVAGFFDISVVHLYGAAIFVEPLQDLNEDLVVVSPDAGAAKRAQKFADLLDVPLVFIEKKRNLDKLHTIQNMRLVGEVAGKTAVLIDDVITSGSTLVKGAYMLKEQGAKKVVACVTHADFIEGTDNILKESPIDTVFVSDSIPVKSEQHFSRLKVVSLAPLLAEQIKKMA